MTNQRFVCMLIHTANRPRQRQRQEGNTTQYNRNNQYFVMRLHHPQIDHVCFVHDVLLYCVVVLCCLPHFSPKTNPNPNPIPNPNPSHNPSHNPFHHFPCRSYSMPDASLARYFLSCYSIGPLIIISFLNP
jgi:hypothetical protein